MNASVAVETTMRPDQIAAATRHAQTATPHAPIDRKNSAPRMPPPLSLDLPRFLDSSQEPKLEPPPTTSRKHALPTAQPQSSSRPLDHRYRASAAKMTQSVTRTIARRATALSYRDATPPQADALQNAQQKGLRIAAKPLLYLQPKRRWAQPMISCSSFLAISSMFSGGQPGISMPRRRPMLERTSLISLSDLRPKFGVRSISASVFWTRSPI